MNQIITYTLSQTLFQNNFKKIIYAISGSTLKIISLVKYLLQEPEKKKEDIIIEIDNYDLEFKMKIINNLVSELTNKNIPKTVLDALEGVEECLEKIKILLEKIKDDIDNHNNKYFNSWRGIIYSVEIKEIKKYNDLLEKRYHMLLELLQIFFIKDNYN